MTITTERARTPGRTRTETASEARRAASRLARSGWASRAAAGTLLTLLVVVAGCSHSHSEDEHHADEAHGHAHDGEHADEGGGGWSLTAWGERFEVFAEAAPLVAGESAAMHVHVTRLAGFEPLAEGEVAVVLSAAGEERVFAAETPERPGIFEVEIAPERQGELDLALRIRDAAGAESIRGGRVRVGDEASPGALVVAPAPKGGSDRAEPVDFSKEQQWQSDFATAWVRSGSLATSVAGLATIRPPAGGEAMITAPVDGIVRSPSTGAWPFAGLAVERGRPLFRLSPLVAAERSLPALAAELSTLDTELATAEARLGRLEELLELEAASRREVEEARAEVETLTARRTAAADDLRAARSARAGGASSGDLVLRAPFTGEVARVAATPGATVEAGEVLARLVGSDLAWIEVEVSPAGARRLAAAGIDGVVLEDREGDPIRLERPRLVSIAPEVAPETGTVTVRLEAPRAATPALGTTLEARILSAERREGIVVPSSALVDDGGVSVVYLQLGGERFARQQVRVVERQGDRALVERLEPGQRLVVRGGADIRRSALMAGGGGDSHAH